MANRPPPGWYSIPKPLWLASWEASQGAKPKILSPQVEAKVEPIKEEIKEEVRRFKWGLYESKQKEV